MKRSLIVAFAILGLIQTASADGSVYGMGGSGITTQGQSTGYKGGVFGFRKAMGENVDLDFLYYNEGTAKDYHRDGPAVMRWSKKVVTKDLSIQAGAGPYLSMNTTSMNGEQENEKKIGALVALAALYRIHGTHFYLKAQATGSIVPGSDGTGTIYFGAGYEFNEAPTSDDDGSYAFSMLGGNSQTTREHSSMAKGFQVEVRKLEHGHRGYSVSITREGDSGVTDRKGVAAQVWYVIPTADDKWTFNVAAGPYVTYDKRETLTQKIRTSLLASMEVSRRLNKSTDVVIRFNRAISTNDKDQDMFFVGLRFK